MEPLASHDSTSPRRRRRRRPARIRTGGSPAAAEEETMGTTSVQKSWRKACGAIKDSTTVGLARAHSKDLDVAVVKATNHVERPPKERHLSSTPPSPPLLPPRLRRPIHRSRPRVLTRLPSPSPQRSSPPRPAQARSPTCPTASTPSPAVSPRRTTGWYAAIANVFLIARRRVIC